MEEESIDPKKQRLIEINREIDQLLMPEKHLPASIKGTTVRILHVCSLLEQDLCAGNEGVYEIKRNEWLEQLRQSGMFEGFILAELLEEKIELEEAA